MRIPAVLAALFYFFLAREKIQRVHSGNFFGSVAGNTLKIFVPTQKSPLLMILVLRRLVGVVGYLLYIPVWHLPKQKSQWQ